MNTIPVLFFTIQGALPLISISLKVRLFIISGFLLRETGAKEIEGKQNESRKEEDPKHSG